MKCSNCGIELEAGARFCQKCGTPVAGAGASSFRPVDAARASGRMKRSTAVGIGAGALLAVALVVGIFLVVGMMGQRSATDAESAATSAPAAATSSVSASASSASADEASSEASEASSEASKSVEGYVQSKAEEQVRAEAAQAGMQVFQGTLHMTTFGERAAEVDSKLVKSFEAVAYNDMAFLELSMPETMTAMSADSWQLTSLGERTSILLINPEEWAAYDGQLVSVAVYPEDLVFPTDVARRLYSAVGNAELIAPLTSEGAAASVNFNYKGTPQLMSFPDPEPESKSSSSKSKSSSSADSSDSATPASASGDYLLPDSATRAYSKSELEKLSDYELFLARNEIYARHGRQFQSDVLQDYFESQDWYSGTIPAGSFDEGILNDTETDNANLIRKIEESRGSQYL